MTILWPPFVGWMFFCSLLFRILSRTRVKSIGDDQQRLSAHSRLQSFMTGSTVFFVVCAFLYGNRHLLQFIGVGRISWLNHSEHFNIRAEVDISSMKDFRGNTLCSAYLVIREIPMLELVIQKVL